MTLDTVRDQLKLLRLSNVARELDNILSKRKARAEIQWLSELLEAELDARKDNAVERRIKRADFPERRSLEQFNWEFNKTVPREKIEELAELKFIENNEIALFLGTPGTGKTHCAIAIGMKAAQAGHSVFCTLASWPVSVMSRVSLHQDRTRIWCRVLPVDEQFNRALTRTSSCSWKTDGSRLV